MFNMYDSGDEEAQELYAEIRKQEIENYRRKPVDKKIFDEVVSSLVEAQPELRQPVLEMKLMMLRDSSLRENEEN